MNDNMNIPTLGFKNIDFDVKKEPWNIYHLKDGSILKVKFILINFCMEYTIDEIITKTKALLSQRKKGKFPIGTNMNSQQVTGVLAKDELKRPPSNINGLNLRDYVVEEDIEVIKSYEYWCEYKFKNGMIIRAKNVLVNVDRTNLYDSGGMPIYLIDNNVNLKIKFPKKIRDKLETRAMPNEETIMREKNIE